MVPSPLPQFGVEHAAWCVPPKQRSKTDATSAFWRYCPTNQMSLAGRAVSPLRLPQWLENTLEHRRCQHFHHNRQAFDLSRGKHARQTAGFPARVWKYKTSPSTLQQRRCLRHSETSTSAFGMLGSYRVHLLVCQAQLLLPVGCMT